MRLFILSLFIIASFRQKSTEAFKSVLDKNEFYRVLKSGTLHEINEEISVIHASGLPDKDAFEGTLLMKKAGLVGVPKQKLDLFKSGRIKLETAIHTDSSNVEYRFMRLIIQEHAPKVVKYQAQVKTDADFITKNFKEVLPELQEIIIDYSKSSEALQSKKFPS
jgi:hypothetical protein